MFQQGIKIGRPKRNLIYICLYINEFYCFAPQKCKFMIQTNQKRTKKKFDIHIDNMQCTVLDNGMKNIVTAVINQIKSRHQ